MGSPFKMSPKTPLMKALVGKQKNLPEHLKQAILDAPAKMTDSKNKSKAKQAASSIGPEMKIEKGKNTTPKMKQTKSDLQKNYKTGAKSPAKMTGDKKKKGKTVDINKPVKNPQPGTEAYAKQERAAGKGSKTFGTGGREIIVSEENKKKYAERRKQKAEERRKKLGIIKAY